MNGFIYMYFRLPKHNNIEQGNIPVVIKHLYVMLMDENVY